MSVFPRFHMLRASSDKMYDFEAMKRRFAPMIQAIENRTDDRLKNHSGDFSAMKKVYICKFDISKYNYRFVERMLNDMGYKTKMKIGVSSDRKKRVVVIRIYIVF